MLSKVSLKHEMSFCGAELDGHEIDLDANEEFGGMDERP